MGVGWGEGCGGGARLPVSTAEFNTHESYPRPAGVCLCRAIPAFHLPTCAVMYPTLRSFSAIPVKERAAP